MMLYESCYYLRSLRVVYLINAALAILMVLLSLTFFSIPYFKGSAPNVACPKLKRHVMKDVSLDPSAFATSPLALHKKDEHFPFLDLKDEILFLGTNSRPDANCNEPMVIVQFKDAKERSVIRCDEPIFLSYKHGYIEVVGYETPLMLCTRLENNELNLTAYLNLKDFSKQFSWAVKPARLPKRLPSDSPLLAAVETLKRMKIYGPDQLIELYGGQEFSDKKGALRLETQAGIEPIENNELWIWNGKDWARASKRLQTQDFPLAQFIMRSAEQVEVKLWDVQGGDQMSLSMVAQRAVPAPIKPQEIFQQLRKRTHSSVSCRIAGKARILRQGDWILKQAEGWRTLRSVDEIDSCVMGQLTGELFVFDKIEKSGASWCLQGHLFDQKRVQAQKVSIPFREAQSKKQHKDIDAYDFDDFDDDDDDVFLSGIMPGGDND
ncbi:MAG: hypothetical protein H7A40_04380 [Chlamydiales bacterium]|nr:hypothetical protein [Chlamydiales bacterium]